MQTPSLINYYDTLHHHVTPTDWTTFTKFAQYGIKLNWTLYYFRWLAVAFTSNTYYGLPLENDSSYQNKVPTVINNNPLIVRTSTTNGKFGGDIENRRANERFSVSLPLFLGWLKMFSGSGIIDSTLNKSLVSKMYLTTVLCHLRSFLTATGPTNWVCLLISCPRAHGRTKFHHRTGGRYRDGLYYRENTYRLGRPFVLYQRQHQFGHTHQTSGTCDVEARLNCASL